MNQTLYLEGGAGRANPGVCSLSAIPDIRAEDLGLRLAALNTEHQRVLSLFAAPSGGGAAKARLFAVLGDDAEGRIEVLSAAVGESYEAFTPHCAQVHLFEREIFEQYGVLPQGHPWLKPVRGGRQLFVEGAPLCPAPEASDFFQVHGDEVHEVAVGPVHAGVIEPGHFRFQCHGEEVLHLEIALGYQHRGIERALLGGPHKRTLFQMETAAGDTSVGHALAYCRLVEALSNAPAPRRAEALRALALELERLANHSGDLGALAGDVAYLPTASYCGRIRGDFLNMTALICGSRLGRGWLLPGGVRFDLESGERTESLKAALRSAEKDLRSALGPLWSSASVMARFDCTGQVSHQDCCRLGLVGPAARACGAVRDVRCDYPFGCYLERPMAVAAAEGGRVAERAAVRRAEIETSLKYLAALLDHLPEGETMSACREFPLAPESFAVSLSEGWRGEVCHCCITDKAGRILRYKIVDPSFHNWMGLALSLRNQQISDFPLCNKSFNLSYAGFDL
jgi:Ni,Fe-hydrogenase III large subunit